MDTEELEDSGGRWVFPDEAARQLVIAVVLRAVLDYRNDLYSCIVLTPNGYDIEKNNAIQSFETFFQDIGFDNYKALPEKVIDFRREVDKIPFSAIETGTKHFKCPLCGGDVTVKRGANKRFTRQLLDRAKRATCDTCQFKIFA